MALLLEAVCDEGDANPLAPLFLGRDDESRCGNTQAGYHAATAGQVAVLRDHFSGSGAGGWHLLCSGNASTLQPSCVAFWQLHPWSVLSTLAGLSLRYDVGFVADSPGCPVDFSVGIVAPRSRLFARQEDAYVVGGPAAHQGFPVVLGSLGCWPEQDRVVCQQAGPLGKDCFVSGTLPVHQLLEKCCHEDASPLFAVVVGSQRLRSVAVHFSLWLGVERSSGLLVFEDLLDF